MNKAIRIAVSVSHAILTLVLIVFAILEKNAAFFGASILAFGIVFLNQKFFRINHWTITAFRIASLVPVFLFLFCTIALIGETHDSEAWVGAALLVMPMLGVYAVGIIFGLIGLRIGNKTQTAGNSITDRDV